ADSAAAIDSVTAGNTLNAKTGLNGTTLASASYSSKGALASGDWTGWTFFHAMGGYTDMTVADGSGEESGDEVIKRLND
ncbi:MAG: hypothetical protein ACQEQV_05130, partial [Fibrobacterota bacterium]